MRKAMRKTQKNDLEEINRTTLLDTANEKLYMARVFEGSQPLTAAMAIKTNLQTLRLFV